MITELFSNMVTALLAIIKETGYLGIFLGMVIESTFIPLPSEIILIPAGVLVAKGEMSFLIVFLAGVFGSLIGATINYFLSLYLGRATVDVLISKYGNLFFINKEKIKKSEIFFNNDGEITTFVGRLIPGARHLISIPAGFLKMNFSKFCLYTSLGAGLWTLILIYVGYFVGNNASWVNGNKDVLTLILLLFSAIVVIIYLLLKKRKK